MHKHSMASGIYISIYERRKTGETYKWGCIVTSKAAVSGLNDITIVDFDKGHYYYYFFECSRGGRAPNSTLLYS